MASKNQVFPYLQTAQNKLVLLFLEKLEIVKDETPEILCEKKNTKF